MPDQAPADARIPPANAIALVMAGGEGRRMGGIDKGLLPWATTTLAGHAAGRLAALRWSVRISANRFSQQYAALGYPVIADRRAGFNGPLAALEAGLYAAQGHADFLLAVPCDTPFFPADLPERLLGAAVAHHQPGRAVSGGAAFARHGEDLHPVFCVLSVALAGTLTRFLDDGGRRMRDWWTAIDAESVDFSDHADLCFANANTPAALAALQAQAST